MKDIISLDQFTRDDLLKVIEEAKNVKEKPPGPILAGKVMASCFFEPSTRTRLSFEAAMRKLGGEVIGFSDAQGTAAAKGESLSDGMRVIGSYADVVVMRHPVNGSAKEAADASESPVINGGDGTNEHPTQTLIDLFTIHEAFGTLDGLHIVLAGDLKYGRTAHSLAKALRKFDCKLSFVAPAALAMPGEETLPDFGSVIETADVIYMTRLQKERLEEGETMHLTITPELLAKGKETLKVLHPLPRVDEISTEVDALPQAAYFTQAQNGVPVRQALLMRVLCEN